MIGSKIIATKIKDRTGLPDKKLGATMADVDEWAEEARRQGYTVKGSGWYRYKVRKHKDGRNMTRAEAKQKLIAEYGEFERTTPKHRYVHFCGSKSMVKKLKKALKLPGLKYPKRSAVVK
jgi:NAD(P)H-flavin reductase